MKKLLPFALILSLAACSNTTAEKITEQAVYTITNSYAVAETAAKQYAEGQFGTPKAEILTQIQKYDNIAYSATETVVADSKAGKALTSVEQTAATDAIEVFVKYLASQGISVKSSS